MTFDVRPSLLLSQPKALASEGADLMTDDCLSVLLKDLDLHTARDSESDGNGSSEDTISPPESPGFQQKPQQQQPVKSAFDAVLAFRVPTYQNTVQTHHHLIAQQIHQNMLIQQQLAQQQHFAQLQLQRLQQQQMLMTPQVHAAPFRPSAPPAPQRQQQHPAPTQPPKQNRDGGATGGTTHPWGVCYPQDLTGGVSLDQDLEAFAEFVVPAKEEIAERARLREMFQEYFEGKVVLHDDALDLGVALPVNDTVFTAYSGTQQDPATVEAIWKEVQQKLQADGFEVQAVGEAAAPILRVKNVKAVEGVIGLPATHTVELILYSGAWRRTVEVTRDLAAAKPEVIKVSRVIKAILGQCNCTEGNGGLSAQAVLTMCLAVVARAGKGSVSALLFAFLKTFGWQFDFKQLAVSAAPGDWPQKQHVSAPISVIDPAAPTRNLAPYATLQKQVQIAQTLQYCSMSLSKWDPARSRSALSCVVAYRSLWPRVPLVTEGKK